MDEGGALLPVPGFEEAEEKGEGRPMDGQAPGGGWERGGGWFWPLKKGFPPERMV